MYCVNSLKSDQSVLGARHNKLYVNCRSHMRFAWIKALSQKFCRKFSNFEKTHPVNDKILYFLCRVF